ncbi:helix-turn-helix domain-containing protein [Streptomyces sp. NPDC054933]
MPSRFEYERAVRSSELPPLSRLLLLTLATWADVKTGVIPARLTPSLSTLEAATGMDRSTVRRHLNKLEVEEWVGRDRPDPAAARAKKTRTRYRLSIPKGVTVPESDGYEVEAENTEARGTVPLAEPELGAHSPMTRGAQPLELGAQCTTTRGTVPPKSSYGPERSTEYQQQQDAAAGQPTWLAPLIEAMSRAGINVPWRFKGDDYARLHNDIKRLGIPVMVEHAAKAAASATKPPFSSRWFYDDWHAMHPPAADSPPQLKAVSGGYQPFRNPANHDVYDEDLI